MLRYIILLVLQLIFLSQTLAQADFRKGFIINSSSDTIGGLVDYRSAVSNSKVCRFKDGKSVKEFGPSEISGYGFDEDRTYASGVVEGIFVEVLNYGSLCLYKTLPGYLIVDSENNSYSLQKNDSLVVKNAYNYTREDLNYGYRYTREDSNWKGILKMLVADCATEKEMRIIEKANFIEKELVKIVARYNDCKNPTNIIYKEKKKYFDAELGISGGVVNTNIKLESKTKLLPVTTNYSSADPNIGVVTGFFFPRFSEQLILQIEGYYLQQDFSSYQFVDGSYYESTLNLSTVSIPISVLFRFPLRKYTFSCQAGYSRENNIETLSTGISEDVENGDVYISKYTPFEINDQQSSWWGGIGLERRFGKLRSKLTLRYYKLSDLVHQDNYSTNHERVSFNLVILWP